jgi:2-hydroxy-3-oxopropionate reductase
MGTEHKPTVGFIGLGIMGKPMASNLLRAGYPLVVHNRSRAPVDELAGMGAEPAWSPREVAQHAQVIILMLPNSPHVRQVAAGPDGLFEGISRGSVIIDCSSISPRVTAELAGQAAGLGVDWLDAPVTGGPQGAKSGTLTFMVGGPAQALERVRPILRAMGKTIVHIGERPGSGQIAKACNQVAVALELQAVCESLLLAQAAGVDPAKVYEAMRGGAAGSWQMDVQGPKILQRRHDPIFKAWMHLKDLEIALETASDAHVPLPGTALVAQLYHSVLRAGRGDENISTLIHALEELAGVRVAAGEPAEDSAPLHHCD